MNTIELSGATLNQAVATCKGIEIVTVDGNRVTFSDPLDDGALNEMRINYCTDWSQGGPIIEQEKITICPNATTWWAVHPDTELEVHGATPLEAAMRAYVHAKLGDEIESLNELMEKERA